MYQTLVTRSEREDLSAVMSVANHVKSMIDDDCVTAQHLKQFYAAVQKHAFTEKRPSKEANILLDEDGDHAIKIARPVG